jgi:hypothetical protein
MAIRALASDCAALILALASFALAFFLLVDLGFCGPLFRVRRRWISVVGPVRLRPWEGGLPLPPEQRCSESD